MTAQPISKDILPGSALSDRLLQVVDGLHDVVSIYDAEWRVVFLNSAARKTMRAMGADPDTASGKVLWDLLPQLIGTKFETETRRAAEEQRTVEYEEFEAGLGAWFETRIIPVENGVIAFARDITPRRLAQQAVADSEAQFRTMVDAIPNLAWIANADGWIFWYNRRWYEYTGTTPEQMEGWGWQSVHDPEVLPYVLERWSASIRTGEPFDMEFPLLGADGVFRPFLTRVMPVLDSHGTIVRWVGTNTDVSEQRAAVKERERLLESERQLRELAETANRAKAQFLATMSHELRTPLNAIAGYTDLLDAGVAGNLGTRQREYIHRIWRSQKLLLGLINDILNYAKLEAGRVQYDMQLHSARRIMEELTNIVEVQATQANIEFSTEIEGEPTVFADPEKVQQILMNLCSNAIRAMPDGGTLRIQACCANNVTRFDVADTGHGIPESRLESIFEPFVQLDRDLTQPKDGAGLGLAISRDLALAMNGTLDVQSRVGEGSVFTLKLPANQT